MDKETLLAARLPEADVEIEGVGTVRVRALTRAQALEVRDQATEVDKLERTLLHWALVDPHLSPGEIRQWQEAAPAGEIEPIINKITELSGMTKLAAKEGYKSTGD